MRMNSETILRRNRSEHLERFQRTSWNLLCKSVSSVCLAVVITSRTCCSVPLRKRSRYIEPIRLAIFGPVAIALQQFIGVKHGTFC